MTDSEGRKARSVYRGIKVCITQTDLETPCLVSISTKHLNKPWDDWSLVFPAIRVPIPESPAGSYQDILSLVAASVQALIRADAEYR